MTITAPLPTFRDLELAVLEGASDNQRERYDAGLLPEDELLTLARAELFKAFDGIPRWSWNKHVRDLRHASDCATKDTSPAYEQCDVGEVTATEWENLKLVTRAASETNHHPWLDRTGNCVVEAAAHWLTCPTCKAEMYKVSAKVTIHWAGRALVREYNLSRESP